MYSILIGGAVCSSAVAVRMLHLELVRETAKAVCLQADGGEHTIWFPRKALISKGEYFVLASWFKPNGYQQWFIDRYASISGIGS